MTHKEPIIKIDLKDILSKPNPITIELGCGKHYTKGRINIDNIDMPHVDIVANLENGLPFIPDNSVDEIYSNHFLEHIENFETIMNEITRILKPDGRCHISVPHFSNPYFYSDPTHKRTFGLYTFFYFSEYEHQPNRKVPSFYSNCRIKILDQKLGFRGQFIMSRLIKRLASKIVNINSLTQEIYEENFCYIIPCYEIKICFTPCKNK